MNAKLIFQRGKKSRKKSKTFVVPFIEGVSELQLGLAVQSASKLGWRKVAISRTEEATTIERFKKICKELKRGQE